MNPKQSNVKRVKAQKVEIVRLLTCVPFVRWDRYVFFDEIYSFYGWIDRKKDAYKDFVLLKIDFSQKDLHYGYTTSSAEKSKELRRCLFGENFRSVKHADCQRVEYFVEIPNSIHLSIKPKKRSQLS